MLLGYRGVAKTTILVAWAVHEQRLQVEDYGHSDLHTLFGSAGKQLADTITRFAKRLITEVPFYQCLMPSGDQLSSGVQFDVGPKAPSKDPSFKSAGIFGATTGTRAQRLYLDDVEEPGTAGTVGMRDKLRSRVMGISDLLPPEGGQLVVAGTPHVEDTIYNWLRSRGEWDVRIYPARYPDEERAEILGDTLAPILRQDLADDPSLAGKPTDPGRFDEQALLVRESKSTRAHFARQYLLDTTLGDKEDHPIRLNDLIVADIHPEVAPARMIWGTANKIEDIPIWGLTGDRFNGPVEVATKPEMLEYTGKIMAVDPSGRGKDETSWCVSMILNATIFVPDFGGYLSGFEDKTLRSIAESAAQWGVNAIVVETNFGDGMFEQLLKPHLRAIGYPCQVISKRSFGKKEERICDTLEPLITQHRMVIDTNALRRDAAAREGMGEEAAMQYRLAYQLSRITRKRGSLLHDDRIEVLSIAAGHWVEHMAQDAASMMEDEESRAMDDLVRNWRPEGGQPRKQPTWTDNYIPNNMR